VIDLVSMKAIYFEGSFGENVTIREIPSSFLDEATSRREELLEVVSMFSDDLMEAIFEDRVTEELISTAVRKGTISRQLTPVFVGSAYKNIGVQPLLNAVTNYLPSPADVEVRALDMDQEEKEVSIFTKPP